MTIDPTSSPQDQNNTPIDRSTEPGARSMWHYVWILVIVSGLAAVLGNLGLTAYRANQKAQFKEQLKQVALAIEQYRDTYGRFPPAYTVDADGHRLHSWRTVILPQLGQQDLYEKIHLDEPWDSPHNKQFHTLRPRQYRHTVLSDTVPGEAHLLAVVGRDTMWPEQHSARVADFGRGVSNTGMLLEHSDQEIN